MIIFPVRYWYLSSLSEPRPRSDWNDHPCQVRDSCLILPRLSQSGAALKHNTRPAHKHTAQREDRRTIGHSDKANGNPAKSSHCPQDNLYMYDIACIYILNAKHRPLNNASTCYHDIQA
ncbi:hypothetical protein SRHO_G00105060 [Serrasalmus rhombeus]